jgi:hypothetical protein
MSKTDAITFMTKFSTLFICDAGKLDDDGVLLL